MKNPEARISTLSPVRRATAFFALVCTLIFLPACGKKVERTPAIIMSEQTEVYQQMTGTLDRLTEGAELEPSLAELHTLIDTQRHLKRELSVLISDLDPGKEKPDLSGNKAFDTAFADFFKALNRYKKISGASPKVEQTLQNLHDPTPMPGEGGSN